MLSNLNENRAAQIDANKLFPDCFCSFLAFEPIVRWKFVETDYTKRPANEDIVKALLALSMRAT
jgi:hypothetical protein